MRTTLHRSRSAVARAVDLGPAIEQYAKIGGRAAWTGAQLQQSPWWGCAALSPVSSPLSPLTPVSQREFYRPPCGYRARRTLSASHVDELDSALKMAMRSGAIEWDGEIPMAVGRDVFPLMTVRENLEFVARLYGMDDPRAAAREMIARLGLRGQQ